MRRPHRNRRVAQEGGGEGMNTVPTRATIAELRQRAEQGTAKDQFSLGLMYYKGEGVPQDYIQAQMWYNLAASDLTGDDREWAVKNRDEIAEKMTSEQIAEAQRLAREWKPKSSGASESVASLVTR